MSAVKNVAKMYNGLLSIRALKTPVKLDVRIPCRMALLLAMAIEEGLSSTDPANLVRKIVSEEDRVELLELSKQILEKGDLGDFYQELKELGQG